MRHLRLLNMDNCKNCGANKYVPKHGYLTCSYCGSMSNVIKSNDEYYGIYIKYQYTGVRYMSPKLYSKLHKILSDDYNGYTGSTGPK